MSWKKISSEYAHENPWYKIRVDTVTKPDGTTGTYNVLEKNDAVFIIAINKDGRFPLVKMLRYPTGIESYEVPAGSIDEANSEDAAKRELQEETGLLASKFKLTGTLQSANGIMDELAYVYITYDAEQTDQNAQVEEGITEVIFVTFDEAHAMMRDGSISDAQSIAAITIASLSEQHSRM